MLLLLLAMRGSMAWVIWLGSDMKSELAIGCSLLTC